MIDNTDQEIKDKFLDLAKNGDLDTIKQMIHDGEVNILCTNDFDMPYRGGSRGENASYFALLNGHTDVAEYLIKISSGVIINHCITNDSFIKKIASKGDLKTLTWLQENLFYGRHEKMVGMLSIIYLFSIDEHELVEKIALYFDLDANVITDNILKDKKEHIKKQEQWVLYVNSVDDDKELRRRIRDVDIQTLTKPRYKTR